MTNAFKSRDFVDPHWDVEFIEFPQVLTRQTTEDTEKTGGSFFDVSATTVVMEASGNRRDRLEQKVYVGIANAQHVRLYGHFANAERRRQTGMRMLFGAVVFALTALLCFFGIS